MYLQRDVQGYSEIGKPAVLMVCVTVTVQGAAAPWDFSAEWVRAVFEPETLAVLDLSFEER